MSNPNFRVIIVGGGPVGLVAAHALEHAGIDFLLLEARPEAVINSGSNLVLQPNGIQALAELGLQAHLDEVSVPLTHVDRLDHQSHDLGGLEIFELMREHSGIYPRLISRHDLTKALFDDLNEDSKTRILTNKKLSKIESLPEGVLVTCADGTTYSGTAVLGADGAHSRVRNEMRRLALEYGSTNVNVEEPYLTTYRAIWIRLPLNEHIVPGMMCETHGKGATTQFFSSEANAVVGLYERMEKPTRDRQRWTTADEEAIVKRWESLPLIPNGSVTLGEAYRTRIESGLISLEEGVVDHWSWAGRIALAGDAAHKFTPSTGQGCNSGMIDVLTLVEQMYNTFQDVRDRSGDRTAVPSREQIDKTFKKYQDIRIVTAQAGCERSGKATASSSWSTSMDKFVDCHVISYPKVQRYMASEGIKQMVAPQWFAFLHHDEKKIAA